MQREQQEQRQQQEAEFVELDQPLEIYQECLPQKDESLRTRGKIWQVLKKVLKNYEQAKYRKHFFRVPIPNLNSC